MNSSVTRRGLLALAGVGVTALLLAGCVTTTSTNASSSSDGDPVPGGTLVYGTKSEPGNGGLDPFSTAVYSSTAIQALIYDTLLTKDNDGTLRPLIAESWTTNDDKTEFVFTIRDGATFADGSPITVDDVAFSFNKVRESTLSKKSYLTDLKGLTTDAAARTVTFTFNKSNPAFLNIVSDRKSFFIVSQNWYDTTSEQDRQKTANASGAFNLDHWTQGVEVVLTKNSKYWDQPKPYLDGITFKVVPDENTLLTQLQSGQIDAGWFWNSTLAQQGKDSGLTLGELQSTSTRVLYLNSEGAFNDVRVRQAFSKAVDRDQLAKVGAQGFGEVSFVTEPTQIGVDAPNDSTPNYQRDVEGAKQLLAEAGQTNPTISLVYQADSNDKSTWELLKQQAAEAGITVDLQPVEYSRIQAVFTSGAPFFGDIIAVQNVGRPDVAGDFNQWVPESANLNAFKGSTQTARLQELFGQLTSESDDQKRLQVANDLNQEIAEQSFIVVAYATPLSYSLSTSKVHGYSPDPFDSRTSLLTTWIGR
ncbi:ABC transporter substrate-binding protein [Pseudoclavibacter sp. CFCC 13796]|uniref:ABC transporter substrate-binding protein n=1 Tax=Pseudoclavibacter sp. CFCC 13796 TaxID=2615179 RepID=UPI00130172D1|nr:ABC transporter substrate-binding protein [Pseudoclavibacter sp. CFCC 13796]KAB1659788.1 ABC transporter substrate-binding protein [Pseudoclavibacter sp. CFCC 13796]